MPNLAIPCAVAHLQPMALRCVLTALSQHLGVAMLAHMQDNPKHLEGKSLQHPGRPNGDTDSRRFMCDGIDMLEWALLASQQKLDPRKPPLQVQLPAPDFLESTSVYVCDKLGHRACANSCSPALGIFKRHIVLNRFNRRYT